MREICQRLEVPARSIVDFQTLGDPRSKNIAIVLHGYGQNSTIIKEDLANHLTGDYFYIIPNGVFPMPRLRENIITYRFAWYFFNSIEMKYYIDFNYPSEVLANFLDLINPDHRPVTVIGYSQGGYLAPFLGQRAKNISKVIGINCNFRHDLLAPEIDFDLYAIHGENDHIVEFEKSKNSFDLLKNRFQKGSFFAVKQTTHEINTSIINIVNGLL